MGKIEADIHWLGHLLGQTISHLEGPEALRLVEDFRRSSKRARNERKASLHHKLYTILEKSSLQDRLLLTRAFCEFLRLSNMAEQNNRVRRLHQYEKSLSEKNKSSLEKTFLLLKQKKIKLREIELCLKNIRIDLVLTAHPTETITQNSMRKYKKIMNILAQKESTQLSDSEVASMDDRGQALIESQWLTNEYQHQQITPQTEANMGLAIAEEVLWRSSTWFCRRLDRALRSIGSDGLPLHHNPLVFSSWMGGDRDGNPFVTATVTSEIVETSLRRCRELFARDLKDLRAELSFSEDFCSQINTLLEKLEKTPLKDTELRPAEFISPLLKIHSDLCQLGARALANGNLEDIIRRLHIFELCLLPLDIRQEASVHSQTVAEILKNQKIDYLAMSPEDRFRCLEKLLDQVPQLNLSSLSESSRETLATLEVIKRYPQMRFRSYVISMTENASHLLEVYFLQKVVGLKKTIPVVPLFETPEALTQGYEIMKLFLRSPLSAQLTRGYQQIMVGYSDSGKRAGRLGSAWQIYQVQQKLAELCRRHQIDLEIFHGRGGSIGRGGGPTRLAIKAQPPGVGTKMRITEQGETIEQKLSTPEIAERTFEHYLTGLLENVFCGDRSVPDKYLQLMQQMSVESAQIFRSFVYENPRFLDYFANITPHQELGLLKIGSRPAKRKKDFNFESLRAIPWVFAWTQNRSLLPAWLGVGEALEKLISQGELKTLQQMYQRWTFFASTIDLIEMAIGKADRAVFAEYGLHLAPEFGDMTQFLQESHSLTVEMINLVKQQKTLLADEKVLRNSIAVRTPYVDVLNRIQVFTLQEYRNATTPSPLMEEVLRLTVAGIAAGMRNSG